MQKIEIEFREQEYKKFISGVREACDRANGFFNEISKICGFEMPLDALKDNYLNGGKATAGVIKERVEEELRLAGITSETVINSAVNGDLEKFYKMSESKPQIDKQYLDCLQLNGRNVSINNDNLVDLKQRFTTYISTERGKLIYDKQQTMVNAVNEFLSIATVFNRTNFNLTQIDFETGKVELQLLSYDKL